MYALKWHKSIGFKIVLAVALTAIVVNGFFAYMNLTIQEKHLNDFLLRNATQLSETIAKSIKIDMLENRKEKAYRIMETIAEQEGIQKVRIYSSGGKIIFSTDTREIGEVVNKDAETCSVCHSTAMAKPLEKLDPSERHRTFQSNLGYRILGIINPLYNEHDCSSAECHFHPPSQKVLGVIDIYMPLDKVDKDLANTRNQTIWTNMLSIIVISILIVVIFLRLMLKRIRDLVAGTRKIAEGDLDYRFEVRAEDEMAILARAFNRMTESLSKANQEIRDWIKTLEIKVEDRTKELKAAQGQLLQSEKLAALGKIAATVAHEINNPLAGVFTYIKLMKRKLEQGKCSESDLGTFQKYLTSMGKEVERTSAIVRELLDFTRPKEPIRKPTDINKLLLESCQLVSNQLNLLNIEREEQLQPLPEILVDQSQMKQVFIDIIVNASEAMPSGGVLTLKTAHLSAEQKIVIEFIDTGVGIPEENLTRIFDPFFTTKKMGTGLGLSVVYGIVTRHGGQVSVTSKAGEGANFKIELPIVPPGEGKEQP